MDANGRVYTVHLKVSDASGNTATATHKVEVPLWQERRWIAIDDGPVYVVDGCD